MADKTTILRRPLYVFDLPKDILSSIQLKSGGDPARQLADVEVNNDEEDNKPHTPPPLADGVPSGATASCALCGISKFSNVQEQRSHVKSDFHRYNLKQKLKGLQPISETEFDTLVADLDESISGSDTETSDDEEDPSSSKSKDTTLVTLLKKQAKISITSTTTSADSSADEHTTRKPKRRSAGKAPMYWFTSSILPTNISLGIYRAIFTDKELEKASKITDVLRKKQLPATRVESRTSTSSTPSSSSSESPHHFLCMIGGGHFAAMIISLVPRVVGKTSAGAEERKANVLAHKTFHRYTTRRQQGGAQSSNDAAKGAAHSAGSSLRRYNEAALTNEVRELLYEWRSMIESAELLFVRATGTTNRRTLYGPYEKQVLHATDPRIRGFPFNTQRATQAELMRAFVELTRVKVSEVDEAALAAATKTSSSTTPAPAKPAVAAAPKLSDAEVAAQLHTSQLQSLIRRSKTSSIISYLSTNSLSPNFPFHPPATKHHHHASTPLHLAASTNAPAVVHALLTKASADPTVLNGEGKPAFALAGDRATRDAFRVARHELGDERWDWAGVAGVPPGLSREEAERRGERERLEGERREEERRGLEMRRLQEEEEEEEATQLQQQQQQRKGAGGRPLGTARVVVEKTGAERREEEGRGLTPEMRMRLERERRARAAEERIRRMQGGGGGGGGS
ncbi:MAG: hypothetical protein M1816_007610 [Peltula sp. TS41687]|nr:MAG: hypothetical protein M1816_007610 [Peltula sp. TS41687]